MSTPPHGHDPFDVLGLPARFDLSPAEIRRAWLERAAAAHPDHADSADASAERGSAALNEARKTLDDPERRAAALLARLGGASTEHDRSLPPGLLMEFLERKELVDEARSSGAPLDEHEGWAEERRTRHLERVSALFRDSGENPKPETLRALRLELNAWRYVERFIEQLDPDYDPARADFN